MEVPKDFRLKTWGSLQLCSVICLIRTHQAQALPKKNPLPRSKGTKILAADGATILEVAAPPEQHTARATVLLQAQEAKLQVTPDHRVVLANGHLAA